MTMTLLADLAQLREDTAATDELLVGLDMQIEALKAEVAEIDAENGALRNRIAAPLEALAD